MENWTLVPNIHDSISDNKIMYLKRDVYFLSQ